VARRNTEKEVGAMALQTGRWRINANGFEGDLNISSVDAQGRLTGNVFGNSIHGFWDDTEQKITFLREINRNDPSTYQVYTGYRFQNPRQPQAGQNVTFTLAGDFEAFFGSGGRVQRHLFGWFARIEVVG
jgi:cobyric acid synthase